MSIDFLIERLKRRYLTGLTCVIGANPFPFFLRYNAVMESWGLLFNWGQDGGQGIAFQIRDVRVRVLDEVAWVNMKANVDVDPVLFHVTNVYELWNGRWYMVHHHSSLMADPAPHNMFG